MCIRDSFREDCSVTPGVAILYGQEDSGLSLIIEGEDVLRYYSRRYTIDKGIEETAIFPSHDRRLQSPTISNNLMDCRQFTVTSIWRITLTILRISLRNQNRAYHIKTSNRGMQESFKHVL